MLKNIINKGALRFLFSNQTKAIEAPKKYSELYTKATVLMRLNKLRPVLIGWNNFIAPNATLIGEVLLGN